MMDQVSLLRFLNKANLSYERLSELLAHAWSERKYSTSTIGRWASGETQIPKKLAPTLAFIIGREAGKLDQINTGILSNILTDQDKILLDRSTYVSLVHLSNLAIDNLEAQQTKPHGHGS